MARNRGTIRTWVWAAAVAAVGGTAAPARAQVSLADDIIMAAKMHGEAERRESELGRMPGTMESMFKRSPGGNDIVIGIDPKRRIAPLPRLTRPPTARGMRRRSTTPPLEREHGLASFIEGLGPLGLGTGPPRGEGGAPRNMDATRGNMGGAARTMGGAARDLDALPRPPVGAVAEDDIGPALFRDEGPPEGMTLDAAIERLIQHSRELRTKYFEIPQARADILTAGLRANPLVFYSTGGIPYGRGYSENRPGEIEHGISLVYPVDFSGKRRARVAVARADQKVLEAQYQDEVRRAIDDLYTAFVDALAARQALRAARHGLEVMDRELRTLHEAPAPLSIDREVFDDLIIERDIAAISAGDEEDRFDKARHRLATLLDVPPEEADALELHGSLRALDGPRLPPVEDLVGMALRRRPDLIAEHRGTARARAELAQERAERFADAYFLYTPFVYTDNNTAALQGTASWGLGVFASVPLFNRNQGNLLRARLNIDQAQIETAEVEHTVIAEVREAASDFQNSLADAERLESVTLPAVRRKRDRARARLRRGEIAVSDFIRVERDTTALVRYYRDTLARHRRDTLHINTVVGMRLLP